MKSLILLAVAVLMVVAHCAWTVPKALVGDKTHVKHYSTYLDKSSLNTHIAFCAETTTDDGVTTQELRYASFNSKNEPMTSMTIASSFGCRVAKISGDGYTKGLVIAFEGQRSFHLGVCNATNPKGCYDVFVTDSAEEGQVWSEPVPVSRSNLADVADRVSPSLIVNMDTKRFYVFYTRRPIDHTEPTMAYVTRPPKSKVFVSETVTTVSADDRFIAALPTFNNKRMIMHIFTERRGHTIHVFSENSITWSESEVMSEKVHFSSFVADSTIVPTLITGVLTDGTKTMVAASTDHGKTWPLQNQFTLTDKYHRVSAGMLCKSTASDDLKLNIIMTSFMQTDQVFSAMKVTSGEKAVAEAPFTKLDNYGVFMPQMWCYTSANTKKPAAKAFAYVWVKPNAPMVYVSDNEDI